MNKIFPPVFSIKQPIQTKILDTSVSQEETYCLVYLGIPDAIDRQIPTHQPATEQMSFAGYSIPNQ